MFKFFTRLFSNKPPREFALDFSGRTGDFNFLLSDGQAMRLAAVQAAVKAISNETASLSIHTYERKRGGGRRVAWYHPTYRLVHDRANENATSDVFQRAMGVDLSLHGNFFALIEREGTTPTRLFRIEPSKVKVKFENAELVYKISGEDFSPYDVLHIKGLSIDGGLTGISPIEYARSSIDLAQATEKIGERYFKKGLIGPYLVKFPAGVSLPPDKKKVLKDDIDKGYAGVGNAFSSIMLENGGDISAMTLNFEHLQWLESRKLSYQEITSGIFGVPGPFVGFMENMSQYGSIAAVSDLFYRNCIRSIAVSIENEFSAKLLREDEKGRYYVECNVDSLLRGNPAVQSDIWAREIAAGIITVDEVRAMKNLPPLPEKELDMPSTNSVKRNKVNRKALFLDCSKRVLTKELNALRRAHKKFFSNSSDTVGFQEWANDFYESQLRTIEGTFTPVLKAITSSEKRADRKLEEFQNQLAGNRFDIVSKAMECDEPGKAIEYVISELEKQCSES